MDENRTKRFNKVSRDNLKRLIVELYTHVLSWQMKILCAYHQQQTNLFHQGIGPSRDWEKLKNDLRTKGRDILFIAGYSTAWGVIYHLETSGNSATSDEVKLQKMHSGDVPMVCAACGNLDPDIWGMGSYSTYVWDVQCASSRCPICMVIIKGISGIVKPIDKAARLGLYPQKQTSLRVTYSYNRGVLGEEGFRNLEFYTEEGMYESFFFVSWTCLNLRRALRTAVILAYLYLCRLCRTLAGHTTGKVLTIMDVFQKYETCIRMVP